jgi:hypothetical protein
MLIFSPYDPVVPEEVVPVAPQESALVAVLYNEPKPPVVLRIFPSVV